MELRLEGSAELPVSKNEAYKMLLSPVSLLKLIPKVERAKESGNGVVEGVYRLDVSKHTRALGIPYLAELSVRVKAKRVIEESEKKLVFEVEASSSGVKSKSTLTLIISERERGLSTLSYTLKAKLTGLLVRLLSRRVMDIAEEEAKEIVKSIVEGLKCER